MKQFWSSILCLLILLGTVSAQDQAEKPNEPPEVTVTEERVESLKNTIQSLADAHTELDRLRAELELAKSESEKTGIQNRIDSEQARLEDLRSDFRFIIGGTEAAEYDGTVDQDLSIENLMVDLLKPLSRAVRDVSATPRELDVLREKLAEWRERKQTCEIILKRIDEYEQRLEGEKLPWEFDAARRDWEARKAKCSSRIGVLTAQIADREKRQRPALETLSDSIGAFFRSRGLNLILGLLTGVLVFVILRKLYDQVCKVSPVHRSKPSLTSRLVDILAVILTALFTLWAVMLVFYIRGDWLLLTLVVLFLIGAIWAGKSSLPPYIDQVRTLLNLGSIRESERVIYEGLPYQVKSLGFLTTLHNPRLQGGEYRIPVRNVMHMISRMPDDKEPWFPTAEDDWVVMADETYGKVITQTPEQVVLLKLGGSLKTYPTREFLDAIPENLSRGYRVACTFGIDYMHQMVSTQEVPEIMETALKNALHEKFDRDYLRSVKVEFKEAGASSLDYQINVDVSGDLDSRYHVLSRFVQRVCVDACNENDWVIPFTQITVHQAADTTPVEVNVDGA